MPSGIPVVVAANGKGIPVRAVTTNAPLMTVATNGLGIPIVISDLGAPFIVQGLITPVTILGESLIAWWTADRFDLITRSGSLVTSWRDVVAGHDMVQGVSASRPVWSATSFNGAPAVDYDGSDDQLTLTGVPGTFPMGAAPCEIWVVFDNEALGADTTTRRIFNYGGTTLNDSRALYVSGVSGTQNVRGYTGTGATSVFSPVLSMDAGGRHSARLSISATGIAVAMDGSALTAETSAVSATGSSMVRSGLGTNGSGPLNGKIRDIVVTPSLTGDDLTAMWAWAQTQRRL